MSKQNHGAIAVSNVKDLSEETRQDMKAQKAILVTKLKSQFLDDGRKGGFVVKFELSCKDHPSFILSSYLLIKF